MAVDGAGTDAGPYGHVGPGAAAQCVSASAGQGLLRHTVAMSGVTWQMYRMVGQWVRWPTVATCRLPLQCGPMTTTTGARNDLHGAAATAGLLAQAQSRDHWDRPGGDWEGNPRRPPPWCRSGVPTPTAPTGSPPGRCTAATTRWPSRCLRPGRPASGSGIPPAGRGRSPQHRSPPAGARSSAGDARRRPVSAGAAAWGHGDARHLLDWIDSSSTGQGRPEDESAPDPTTGYTSQDQDFYPEVRLFLSCLMAARPAAPAGPTQ